MPQNMSFKLTVPQIRAGTKNVTRRLGWWFLYPGDIVNAVEKCRGLKKGEKVKVIRQIYIIATYRQSLTRIDAVEVIREGFPGMTPYDFIEMFKKANHCSGLEIVNRIEFKYVDEPETTPNQERPAPAIPWAKPGDDWKTITKLVTLPETGHILTERSTPRRTRNQPATEKGKEPKPPQEGKERGKESI